MNNSAGILALAPFPRLLALIIGVVRTGHWLSGFYGKVAAVFLFIATVEAFLFAFWHFKRIRNFKKGWRQRLTPDHLSWITKSSIIMCVIEPVAVAILIFVCGICVGITWPLWILIVMAVSIYELIHYGIKKVKQWRGKLPTEFFHINKVKDFPWKYGDHDGDVIDSISMETMAKRTKNGGDNDSKRTQRQRKK